MWAWAWEPNARYDLYFAAKNIWTIRGKDKLREGAVLTGEMVCSNRDLERSEDYNDYLKRLGYYHALTVYPLADTDTTLLLSTLRTRRRGAFEHASINLERQLTPHLKRAAQVHDRLAVASAGRGALCDALERMPAGVVLLDGRGCILFANRAARRSRR